MFHHRVYQHDLISFRIKRNIFVFQRTTIQTDQVSFFPEYRSKLVHNTTFHTAIIMFGSLSYFCQFKLIDTQIKYLIQGKSKRTFQRCRRRQTCPQRNISREGRIKTFDFSSTFNYFAHDTEDITSPAFFRSVFLIHTELRIFIKIDCKSPNYILPIRFYLSQHTFINSSRQNKTSVIIGMFSNQIYPTR